MGLIDLNGGIFHLFHGPSVHLQYSTIKNVGERVLCLECKGQGSSKHRETSCSLQSTMIWTLPKSPLELYSASKTKAYLFNILGDAVLETHKGSKKNVVVVKGTTVQVNHPHIGSVNIHSQSRGGRHHDTSACK